MKKIKKASSDSELEKALSKVNKEIKENKLQSITTSEKMMTKKTKKTKKTKATTGTTGTTGTKATKTKSVKTAKAGGGYTGKQLAEEFSLAPADLRKGLRAIKATKPGKSWEWPKKTDAALVAIRKSLKEHFAKPKATKAKPVKEESKKTTKKAVKKAAKKKVVKKKKKAA